jgi:hypothetical protein
VAFFSGRSGGGRAKSACVFIHGLLA